VQANSKTTRKVGIRFGQRSIRHVYLLRTCGRCIADARGRINNIETDCFYELMESADR
jgi:hypothetical protein